MVGSPPDTTTAFNTALRFFKKAKISSCAISGSSPITMLALWQNGQRKLQPPVKIMQAVFSG